MGVRNDTAPGPGAGSVLVVLDDTPDAHRAVRQSSAGAASSERAFILMYVLPPLPPELLENRGAEDPAEETAVEAVMVERQEAWLAAERAKGERVLSDATSALRDTGVPAAQISSEYSLPLVRTDIAEHLARKAHEHDAREVVIGRTTLDRLEVDLAKTLARSDPAPRLRIV